MILALSQRRRARAAWAIAAAVLAILLSVLALGAADGPDAPPESPGLAAPDYAARPQAAERIRVTTREGAYELARGRDGRWSMRERGGYPVRPEMVQAFERGLTGLRLGRAMTRDPAKHARLGLGAAEEGGAGVHVQALDARGALLANVILGATDDGAFARRAAEPQAWTAEGEMPQLKAASAWLNLTPFEIAARRVARVDLAPPAGPPYAILRLSPDEPFFIGAPFSRYSLRPDAAPGATAIALGAVAPLDVAPAPALPGPPRGRAVMRTFDGLAIEAELYAHADGWWLKLSARADQVERAPEAAAINRRAGPWAFQITQEEAARAFTPLDALALRPKPAL